MSYWPSASPVRRQIRWQRWTKASEEEATLWSIVNAIGSQAMRIVDASISMQTGPEIGVASTKAFTAPLADQYMLAILLGTYAERSMKIPVLNW